MYHFIRKKPKFSQILINHAQKEVQSSWFLRVHGKTYAGAPLLGLAGIMC